MKLTDFLGREYGEGDLVLYAAMGGRCPNMIIGRVTDIYRVWHNSYYVGERYGWERLADGDPVPHHYAHDGTDLGECKNGNRVKVQPLRAARWEQHRPKKYYVDTRSGKRIDPDRGKGLPHMLKESHYVFTDGTEFDWAAEQQKWTQRYANAYGRTSLLRSETFEYYFRRTYHVNYGEVGVHRFPLTEDVALMPQLWWVSRTYQPWVEERYDGPKPVTLEITDNIVKWEGELPDEVPVQVP